MTRNLEETTRHAQDTLVLLATGLGGAGLVLAGGMLPVPMLGCLGLPIAMVAGLAFAIGILVCGRLEVPMWRQVVGVALAVVGLHLFFHAYLGGLAIIAEHYLGRAGAPPLSDLVHPGLRLGIASLLLGASVGLRRAKDLWVSRAIATVTALTGALAWLFLIVLAILGVPLGA
jgi:hypothetical protein